MSLPNDLQILFNKVENEVIWLHGRWIIFRQLYGTSEERVELLNRSASTFFGVIQDILYDDIFLTMSRLTDPSKSLQNDNLSLSQLIERLDQRVHAGLIQSLTSKLDTLKQQCRPFRIWRNKKIAHSDLRTALGADAQPLPEVTRDAIEGALHTLREFMNEFLTHFGGTYTGYEYTWLGDDGDTLIGLLRQFWKYREAENDQIDRDLNRKSKEQSGQNRVGKNPHPAI